MTLVPSGSSDERCRARCVRWEPHQVAAWGETFGVPMSVRCWIEIGGCSVAGPIGKCLEGYPEKGEDGGCAELPKGDALKFSAGWWTPTD